MSSANLLTPPARTLFNRRPDPTDIRLGEVIEIWDGKKPLEEILNGAFAAIVGWPDDRGIALSQGRLGAAQGPDAIRKAFYNCTIFQPPSVFQTKRIIDLGNLIIEGETPEKSQEKATELVTMIVKNGVLPIVLGGGNDYAYADVMGSHKAFPSHALGVINVDAHYDVRDLSFGVTSGTPYFRLFKEGDSVLSGKNFIEFASQPAHNSLDHRAFLKSKGAEIIDLVTLQTRGAKKVFYECLARLKKNCPSIVVSIDIDSVRQADAPGASASYPNGLSAMDVENIGKLAGAEPSVKLFSVYEVSPPLDRDGQTAALAASIIWSFLSARMS